MHVRRAFAERVSGANEGIAHSGRLDDNTLKFSFKDGPAKLQQASGMPAFDLSATDCIACNMHQLATTEILLRPQHVYVLDERQHMCTRSPRPFINGLVSSPPCSPNDEATYREELGSLMSAFRGVPRKQKK